MSVVDRPSVFNQFTFFSLLIPGLFAFAVLLPFASSSLFTQNVAWVVVFILSFSFVVGAVIHIISEALAKYLPFFNYPAAIFHHMLTENTLRSENRDLSQSEKRILHRCIDILEEYELVETQYDDLDNHNGYEYTRHDSGVIYQFLLNNAWVKGSTARIHTTIRMMCRSLAVISIGLIPVSVILVISISSSYITYSPIYSIINNNFAFLLVHLLVLAFLSVGFIYGQKRYATYLVFYMMVEFVDPKEY